jgi:hypothetical protein
MNRMRRRKKNKKIKEVIEEIVQPGRRRISIYSKGKTYHTEDYKSTSPKSLPKLDQYTRVTDPQLFKKEVESLIQDYGGNYELDFGFKDQLRYGDGPKWGSVLNYIWGDSNNERVSSVIKTMKGKKEIEDMIENSGFKDMLMSHENVLRSYIMEKSVLPKLKRDSQAVVNPRNSVFRLDTVTALNNLIHEKSFMDDIKKGGGNKTEGRNKLPKSIDISNNRKVAFNDDALGVRSARPLSDTNISANEGNSIIK